MFIWFLSAFICGLWFSLPGAVEQAVRQAEAVEGAGGIDDACQDRANLGFVLAVDHRGNGAQHAGALVDDALRRAVAAHTGHVGGGTARLAAAAGGQAGTQDALFEQAVGGVGLEGGHTLKAPDALLGAHPLALVAHGARPRPQHCPVGGQGFLAVQGADDPLEHRRDLLALRRTAGDGVVDRHHLGEGLQAGIKARAGPARSH